MSSKLAIKEDEKMKDDIYSEEGITQKAEEESISDYEEAFMRGYCIYCD